MTLRLITLLLIALAAYCHANDVTDHTGEQRPVDQLSERLLNPTTSRNIQVVADTKTITINNSQYFLGDFVNATYSSSNNISFQYSDKICTFYDNTTDFDDQKCLQTTFLNVLKPQGSVRFRAKLGVGNFKAALFLGGYVKAVAVSNVFKVLADEKTLSIEKSQFFQGEAVNVTYSSFNKIPFQFYDFICAFPVNVTAYYSYNCGQSTFLYGSRSQGTASIIPGVGVGKFKAVLFFEGNDDAVAVSNEFEVVADTKTLTIDKAETFLGDFVNVTYGSLNRIPFQGAYRICAFSENVTQFFSYNCEQSTFLRSSLAQGSVKLRAGLVVGKFKAVLFLAGDDKAIAVSNVFEVVADEKTLSIEKAQFFQGEAVNVTYSSFNKIPFQFYDFICAFPVNVTAYYSYNCEQSTFLYGSRSQGTASIIPVGGVGKFKAVLFFEGNDDAVAVSNEFEVVADTKTLTIDKAETFLGDFVNVTYSSLNRIPFQGAYRICLFSENVTQYFSYNCEQSRFLQSSLVQGSVELRVGQGVGKFKAVLFLSENVNAVAASNVFEVVADEKTLTIEKSQYFLGEAVNVTYSSFNKIPFQFYDSICIFSVNVTAYYSYNCGQGTLLYGSRSQGTASIRPGVGVGKFKAVLFFDGNEKAVAMSNVFEVVVVGAPTKVPTKAPTKQPTKSPTKMPSKVPTRSPTKVPSKVPTKPPTKIPSKVPTRSPSKLPTKAPTKMPSNVPTKIPTKIPTKAPLSAPITIPANAPFNVPVKSPTKAPINTPVLRPTILSPTKVPLNAPVTASPTMTPVTPPTNCGLFGLNFLCLPISGNCGFWRRLFNVGGC